MATVGVAGAWLLLVLYVAQSVMPHTVAPLPPKSAENIAFVLPQGWSFFTRNPREPSAVIYRPGADARWVPASRAPNFRSRNLFGASRIQRAEGIDLGVLYSRVAEKSWAPCREVPARCLARFERPIAVDISRDGFLLCGDVGFVAQEPVPWAWARDRSNVVMPSKVVRLSVRC